MTAAKLIHILSDLFLTLGLALAALLLLNRFLGHNSAHLYLVSSGSMSPAIPTGSLVVTYPRSRYRIGDIVTFFSDAARKSTITHRIVSIGGGVIRTAGDANNTPEPTLTPASQIIGAVVFHIPYVGFLAGYTKTPFGFILLVIVPATIIIYEELRSLARELAKLLSKYLPRPKFTSVHLIYPLAILLPLIGGFLIYTSFSNSFFSDLVTSTGNSIIDGLPSPTPPPDVTPAASPSPTAVPATPTPTPDATLTPTVTPSPTAVPSDTSTPTPAPTSEPLPTP